jgi:hypothetical protein
MSLNLILLAGPVLTEAGPVLLCANITYIEFEFDPVASQHAPPPSRQAHPLSTTHEIKTHHRLYRL